MLEQAFWIVGIGRSATRNKGIFSPYTVSSASHPMGLLGHVPAISLMQIRAACVKPVRLGLGIGFGLRCCGWSHTPSLTYLPPSLPSHHLRPLLHLGWHKLIQAWTRFNVGKLECILAPAQPAHKEAQMCFKSHSGHSCAGVRDLHQLKTSSELHSQLHELGQVLKIFPICTTDIID